MPRSEQVILTYHDRIAVIRINKPERLNACDLDNYYDIASALREIDAKKDVYITVITGTGRYFSAYAEFPASLHFSPWSFFFFLSQLDSERKRTNKELL